MKKFLLHTLTVLLLVICVEKAVAQPPIAWAKRMGGTDWDAVSAMSVDAAGNVYSLGEFEDTADFDPEAGVHNLVSQSLRDLFVSKLDASGNFVWALSLDAAYNDLVTDASGNVYVLGRFRDTLDFDPGTAIHDMISKGGFDLFVLKLSAAGNFIWVKTIEGSGNQSGNTIRLDASGNIYIAGSYTDTTDFDPGAGAYNLVSISGTSDAFIVKLNPSGNFMWAKSMGGSSSEAAISVGVDAAGNVYSIGTFARVADFDPGAPIYSLTSATVADVFISKLDANGNFVWAKSFVMSNSGAEIFPNSLMVDGSGNAYITGCFWGDTDFDPGPGSFMLSPLLRDVFNARLDASGNLIWVNQRGSSNVDIGYAVFYASGNLYTSGVEGNNLEMYVSKLDTSTGIAAWTKHSDNTGTPLALFAKSNGDIYVGGGFSNTLNIDFAGTHNLNSAGIVDAFVVKYSNSSVPVHLLEFTAKRNERGSAGNARQAVQLSWTSADEQSFSHYEIERSANGRDFSKCGSVKAKAGNGNNAYKYIDHSPLPNNNYYRLKLLDNDGSFTYSKINKISFNLQQAAFNIVPNPATTQLQLQFAYLLVGNVQIEVSDASGKVVIKREVEESNIITLSTSNLPAGTYVVKVVNGSEAVSQVFIIKK